MRRCVNSLQILGETMKKTLIFAALVSVVLGGCSWAHKNGAKGASDKTRVVARFESFTYKGNPVEQAVPAEDEYQNPILSGYYPDPSVTRVDDTFYLVNSSFTHFPGLPIFESKDLVHWQQISNAIERPDQFDFSGLEVSRGIFAPDISYRHGLYWLISTCVDCGGNFVMTADNPAGPWSDPVYFDFEGIDPSIYWEGSKAYVVNNGAPMEPPRYEGHRAIWIQEFDWQNKAMVGERKQLVNGGVDISKKPIWIEGPHLFKRGQYYYITAAEGGTSVDHSQTIFRSKQILGPFKPAEHNPILTQRDLDPNRANPVSAAGHAKFVQLENGDWWATFLSTRPYAEDYYNIGRETFLLPVSWQDDWPHILPPGAVIPFTHRKPLPTEAGPGWTPTTGAFEYRDEFTGSELAKAWLGVRVPSEPFYRLERGALQLQCAGPFGDLLQAPSFIGRRQQHHIAEVSTELQFAPSFEGDQAGLAAVQNDESLIFFGVQQRQGKPELVVYQHDKSANPVYLAQRSIADADTLNLTIKFEKGRGTFTYTAAGQTRTLIKDVDMTPLSTHRAGGFVGTVVGPYCASSQAAKGELESLPKPADSGEAAVWRSDNGDGTYTNPPLWADYPDPDIIRVGEDFYFATTTFANTPGLRILHSKDLVNWQIIGYVEDELTGKPEYNFEGGDAYRKGLYAPSLRYHQGVFYLAVMPVDQNVRIYRASNPAGPWQSNDLGVEAFDPALFFEQDGTPYLATSGGWDGTLTLMTLNRDLTEVVTSKEVYYNPGAEGSKIVKRGDYYYMFHSVPRHLKLTVSRAKSLFGPWETREQIDDTTGGHQGALVDLPDGSFYGFVMVDTKAVGRITNISPVFWQDDWPVWGTPEAPGRVPERAEKPIKGHGFVEPGASDDFSNDTLGLQWQWNHNSAPSKWSLTERPGFMRLRATASDSFWHARNTLVQKGQAPLSLAALKVDTSGIQTGDRCGLGTLGKYNGNIAVTARQDGTLALTTELVEHTSAGLHRHRLGTASDRLARGDLWLVTELDFKRDRARVGYSLDGQQWRQLGAEFPLMFAWQTGTFQGQQIAIFCYNENSDGGYLDIDQFILTGGHTR